MKILLLFPLVFFTASSRADIGWLSAGGAYSTFSDMHPKQARELKYGQSWFAELSAMDRTPLFAPLYAYRSTTAKDVKFLPDNQQPIERNFKLTTHDFGARAILPLPWFDLFAGGGFTYGNATLGEKERSTFGRFWQGGIRLYFNQHVGIKFAYQSNKLITSRFSNLDDKKLRFDQGVYSVGLVLRFGSSMK